MYISYFRERARSALSEKWGIAILVAFVASVFGALVAGSSFSLNLDLDEQVVGQLPKIVRTYLAVAGIIGGLLGTMQFIMGGVVKLGYCKFLLKQQDGEEGDVKDLFSQMDRFGDGFLLSLLTGIYTTLWTMLFIIPGIVAMYKYAMAPFILLENPSMRANEAIAESKYLMDGNKGSLFLLHLSFFGWSLLCVLTLGIGYLWLNPYINASYAAFYRSLSPRVVPQPIVDAGENEQQESDSVAE